MNSKCFALYSDKTKVIENILSIDPAIVNDLPDFPPKGYSLVQMPQDLHGEWSACGIGWSYVNGNFVEPAKPAA